MKLLFQGDSITDAGRDRENMHNLGLGYPKFAAQYLREKYPEIDFEFVNLGISGDQTKDLLARIQTDIVDIDPDIISIFIGVNDIWHFVDGGPEVTDEMFEERYRKILTTVKEKTHAKIMMIEPFLVPNHNNELFRKYLDPKIQIVRKLAREFAGVYLPLDGLLMAAYIGDDRFSYAEDCVHPTEKGAIFIAKLYVDYIAKLIEE